MFIFVIKRAEAGNMLDNKNVYLPWRRKRFSKENSSCLGNYSPPSTSGCERECLENVIMNRN